MTEVAILNLLRALRAQLYAMDQMVAAALEQAGAAQPQSTPASKTLRFLGDTDGKEGNGGGEHEVLPDDVRGAASDAKPANEAHGAGG